MKNHTWLWVLGAAAVLGAGYYYWPRGPQLAAREEDNRTPLVELADNGYVHFSGESEQLDAVVRSFEARSDYEERLAAPVGKIFYMTENGFSYAALRTDSGFEYFFRL